MLCTRHTADASRITGLRLDTTCFGLDLGRRRIIKTIGKIGFDIGGRDAIGGDWLDL